MRRTFFTTLLIVIVFFGLLLVGTSTRAQTASKASDEVAVTIAAQLWRSEVIGPMVNRLTVSDGYVYTFSGWSGAPANNLYCFDASNGRQVWNFSGSFPVFANGYLYATSFTEGKFYALNASTGKQIWSLTDVGYSQNAVVTDGIVYLGTDNGNVYALNASSGAQVWTYNESEIRFSSHPITVKGEYIYIIGGVYNSQGNSWSSVVYALRASDGKKIWSFAGGGYFGSLEVADGKAVVTYSLSGSTGNGYTGGIIALDALSGARIWEYSSAEPLAAPAVANSNVYVLSESGNVYAFRASNGALLWNYSSGADIWSTDWTGMSIPDNQPLLVDNSLYFTSYEGVYCLNVLSGAEVWKYVNPTRDYSYSPGARDGTPATPPTYANGTIFVGSGGPYTFTSWLEHNIYALDAASGAKIWNYTIENVVNNPVVVMDDTVYVSAWFVTHYNPDFVGNGAVYAFKLTTANVPRPTPSPPPATPPSGSLIVPDQYPTIQEAIDNAVDGNTVFVRRGVYYAEGYSGILINKQISLIGEDPRNTVILAQWYRYANNLIQVTADNVTVSGFTVSSGGSLVGILVEDSYQHVPSRCTITGNNIVGNSDGILTRGDSNSVTGIVKPSFHVISGNNISDNSDYGIYVSSSNTTISGNNITGNGADAVIADECVNVTISGNNIAGRSLTDLTTTHNNGGLYLRWWGSFYVYGNNITEMAKAGIAFGEYCNNCSIHDNNIANNGFGVELGNVTEDFVGKGNQIFHNNFENNRQQVQVGSLTDLCTWDNGSVGNYWSDYQSKYTNATEIGNSGIGNTPYVIDANNADYYPLMKPVQATVPSQSSTPTPTASTTPTPTPTTEPPVTTIAIAAIAAVVAVAAALLILKRKQKKQLNRTVELTLHASVYK
ncbi:MAG: PQQ-binding-like beta-propeller repeat protein [Candidatus Bathyarchaeia archaeon]